MIDSKGPGHRASVTLISTLESTELRALPAPTGEMRLRQMLQEHGDFVFRSLRRLGVPPAAADDATQQVWIVVARKLQAIEPSRERSFLFGTAMRVASEERRARGRRRESFDAIDVDALPASGTPDEALEQVRARAFLDAALAELPIDQRAVFVLFEIEEMSTPEIAALLEIPLGTAASRLRRARESFDAIVTRMRARRGNR